MEMAASNLSLSAAVFIVFPFRQVLSMTLLSGNPTSTVKIAFTPTRSNFTINLSLLTATAGVESFTVSLLLLFWFHEITLHNSEVNVSFAKLI